MAIAEITTASANVNLTSAVSVLNYTNSGTETFGQLTFVIGGAVTNQLHTDGGTLTFRISVGGVQGQAIEATVESGQLRLRQDADPIYIDTGEVVAVTIESSNANDTSVTAEVTLRAAEPLQPITRGRSLLVDGDGKVDTTADLPTTAEFEARTLPTEDYFVVGDYTAPPTATDVASEVKDQIRPNPIGDAN